MLTPAELKARETRLKADEVNWQAARSQLERQIAKYKDTLAAMEVNLKDGAAEKLRQQEQLDKITADTQEKLGQLAIMEQTEAAQTEKVAENQRIIADQEAVIASKKAEIKAKLDVWEEAQRQNLQSQLKPLEDKLATAHQELQAVMDEVASKQEQFIELQQRASEARIGQQRELDLHQQAIRQLEEHRTPLEGEIKALEEALIKLTRQRELTLADTRKAKAQHENFVDYERRARSILENKDRELQDKAQELAQEDRHLRARRSYLADL